MAAFLPAPDQVADAFDVLVGGGVERGELDRGGRMLRWIEAGDGATTVVFEAGAMSPVATFAAVFKALATDHRVIAYDRAGYGASDAALVDLDLQLDDLAAVLEKAGRAPCVLVGHSWGGLLAQLVTWARPDLVSGLVLLDPSHETFWLDLTPETLADMGRHPSRTSPASADPRSPDVLTFARELATDTARSVGADPHVENLLIAACLSYLDTDDQLFTYLNEVPMILDHLDDLVTRRSQALWPSIPVVLLTATKGRPKDSTPRVLAVQDRVAAAAKAHHVIVPTAGHYIHLDQPDLVATWTRDVARRSHSSER